jgi:hypothetical protein
LILKNPGAIKAQKRCHPPEQPGKIYAPRAEDGIGTICFLSFQPVTIHTVFTFQMANARFNRRPALSSNATGFWGTPVFSLLLHHLADICQASAPLGVLGGTIATAGLLFVCNFSHDGRITVFQVILFDIIPGIPETKTDKVFFSERLFFGNKWIECFRKCTFCCHTRSLFSR